MFFSACVHLRVVLNGCEDALKSRMEEFRQLFEDGTLLPFSCNRPF